MSKYGRWGVDYLSFALLSAWVAVLGGMFVLYTIDTGNRLESLETKLKEMEISSGVNDGGM